MKRARLSASGVVCLVALTLMTSSALSQESIVENFESYSTGPVAGQGAWSSDSVGLVVDGAASEGTKSLLLNTFGEFAWLQTQGNYAQNGATATFSAYVRGLTTNTDGGYNDIHWQVWIYLGGGIHSDDWVVVSLCRSGDGLWSALVSDDPIGNDQCVGGVGTRPMSDWARLEVEIRLDTGFTRARLGDSAWSECVKCFDAAAYVDRVGMWNTWARGDETHIDLLEVLGSKAGHVTFQFPLTAYEQEWNNKVHGFGSLNLKTSSLTDPYRPHLGVDLNLSTGKRNADLGAAVVSIANGRVVAKHYYCGMKGGNFMKKCAARYPGWEPDDTTGWGHTVVIEHEAPSGSYFLTGTGKFASKIYAVYGHMMASDDARLCGAARCYDASKNMALNVGDTLKKGDPIGQVGDADGKWPAHLHFELREEIDPLPTSYRDGGGYGWDFTVHNFTDPIEFIRNNSSQNYGDGSEVPAGISVVVHAYGDGSVTQVAPTFTLDDLAPRRGVNARYKKEKLVPASVNPCSASYMTNSWRRAGCNYGQYDLGYNGEVFWKPADSAGHAKWIPTLPRTGRYEVSVHIPNDYLGAMNGCTATDMCPYATIVTYEVRSGSTTYSHVVDQDAHRKSMTAGATGKWVTLGTFYLDQIGNPHLYMQGYSGESGRRTVADAARFEYVGP